MIIFTALLLAWSAALWLVLPIDIFQYSLPAIIAMHTAPPIAVIGLGFLARAGYRKVRANLQESTLSEQKKAREAEKLQQKKLFIETLKARRIALDCRWLYVTASAWKSHVEVPTEAPENTAFYFEPTTATANWRQQAIAQALAALYQTAPIASCLPILFATSPSLPIADIETVIRVARKQARIDCEIDVLPQISPELTALPQHSDIYASLSAIFEKHQAWPGAIVLAFDSTIDHYVNDPFLEFTEKTLTQAMKWRGNPAHALVALLLTPPQLSSVLKNLDELSSIEPLSALTPHWERDRIAPGMSNLIASLPEARRHDLAQLPVLAHWHRSSISDLSTAKAPSEKIEHIKNLLTTAAMDAGLIEPAFEFDGDIEQNDAPPITPRDCQWLIHNAGHIQYGGKRMATLGSALWQSGIELDPIANGINTVACIGDCGAASTWLSFALAVQRAAQSNAPVLNATYDDGDLPTSITINFVMPTIKSGHLQMG